MIDRKNNRADHIENKKGKLCIYDIYSICRLFIAEQNENYICFKDFLTIENDTSYSYKKKNDDKSIVYLPLIIVLQTNEPNNK